MEWSEEEEEKKIKRCFWWNEVRIKWCSDGMKRGKKSKNIFYGMWWGEKKMFLMAWSEWKKAVLVEWSEEKWECFWWIETRKNKKECFDGMKRGKARMFLMEWSEEGNELKLYEIVVNRIRLYSTVFICIKESEMEDK